jgi:N-hydroxyarylamine O-acetyltransferase
MDLRAYLDRIGFEGEARPDRATLDAVHRRHLLSIPYENLDVQLGRPLTTSPEAAFAKMVTGRRGGWCYEMNGLLGLALQEIGFPVTRMAGGVVRSAIGEAAVGNHLVLRVDLPEGPIIADVGFGDGPILPFALRDGAFRSGAYEFRLEDMKDGWWRLHNSPRGGAPDFDFRAEATDEAVLTAQCVFLQTSEKSPFTQNLVVQIHHEDDGVSILRGRVLRRVAPDGEAQRLLESADELVAVLAGDFGLDVPEAAGLWDRVVRRHDEVFGAAA